MKKFDEKNSYCKNRKQKEATLIDTTKTRWKGAKARKIKEGVKLYYNGKDTKRNGVAIAVAESLKDHVSAVNRVSDRIMAVRIDTKEGYWSILSVYTPQTGCPKSEKNEFYLSLDDAIRSAPDGDYLAIAGLF
ncbi:hypothetical protein TELCIR_16060 [Teladorsagia circumcincta]|uniref:Uncharacterized protein n=1 Tax=Teladorsagia circumcincta TaxID=45464 RepID=A0A2G9TYS7_TELCI|nr:hypothetical protein TELCIR_16060 [Teladorsagia circumcincta]